MAHAHRKHPAVTLSVRVPAEVRDDLEVLADSTGRSKSFLASEAIETYISTQAWQIKAIKEALKKTDTKNAKFIDNSTVTDWLASWGTDSERKPPDAD